MKIKRVVHQILILIAVFACLVSNADDRQDYIVNWGLSLGSKAPAISAIDEQGTLRSFENLKLEHGLLLFLNRSADW